VKRQPLPPLGPEAHLLPHLRKDRDGDTVTVQGTDHTMVRYAAVHEDRNTALRRAFG